VPWRFSDAGRRSAWDSLVMPASENLRNIGSGSSSQSVYMPLKRFPKGHDLNLLVDRRWMVGIVQF
jgi:hypothetical protein